jgi:hypothetical protein
MMVSWSVPISSSLRSATTRTWFGSASMASKACRYGVRSSTDSRVAPSWSSAIIRTIPATSAAVARRITAGPFTAGSVAAGCFTAERGTAGELTAG